MALRSKIQAFETGGVSNLTPNSKRKRSIYDAEVVRAVTSNSLSNCSVGLILNALQDQKIDLFESLKGQEEGYRRLGPMYRRFGNLKQKFEADLRSLHSNEEEDKENITNRSQPEATRTRQRCTVLAIGANTAHALVQVRPHQRPRKRSAAWPTSCPTLCRWRRPR